MADRLSAVCHRRKNNFKDEKGKREFL